MKKKYMSIALSVILAVSSIQTGQTDAKTTIKLKSKSITLTVGKAYHNRLKNASGTVKWSSNDKEIAKVTNKGKIKGISAGNAKITAKYKKKKYICKVKVIAKNATDTPEVTHVITETSTPEITPEPTEEITETPVPEEETEEPTSTPEPTEEPTPSPEITPSPTPFITPEPTETPSPVPTPTITPSPTPSPTPTPTPEPDKEDEAYYIGHIANKVFHRPDCASAKRMNESNKVNLGTRSEAISKGYRPCERCKP